MDTRFHDIVATEEAVRGVLGAVSAQTRAKTSTALDEHCREFIAASPFLLIASSDADGGMDVSPRGDPPGFVHVLDDATLAIPDRPGNRRTDTFRNLLQRPGVALLFLIPGRGETLRINGTAFIVKDRWLLERMRVNEKPPRLALVVKTGEVFFHCPKSIVRSRLWQPERWPAHGTLASYARIKRDRCGLTGDLETIQAEIEENLRETLY
jgi:PPOX class probable FMN-dependent enzyme